MSRLPATACRRVTRALRLSVSSAVGVQQRRRPIRDDRLRELGYAVRRTGRSGDHGIDLVATRWGETAIVQCKRYTSAAVGEDVIGRLYGSMLDKRADRAYLVTSARVSAPARRWIGSKPIEIWDASGSVGKLVGTD